MLLNFTPALVLPQCGFKTILVLFCTTGYELFKGNFIRFKGGFKHECSVVQQESDSERYTGVFNFAVPSKQLLSSGDWQIQLSMKWNVNTRDEGELGGMWISLTWRIVQLLEKRRIGWQENSIFITQTLGGVQLLLSDGEIDQHSHSPSLRHLV